MIIVVSPAKTLAEGPEVNQGLELPEFRKNSAELIGILKTYTPAKIKQLMGVSDKLAELNYGRYQSFGSRYTAANSKAAIYMFKGDVYQGLDADSLNAKAMVFAQSHLRILSGLYGMLRPMDKMQAYRLEMGTRLNNPKGPNLYEFWRERVTQQLNKDLEASGNNLLVNLASNEYYKVIDQRKLNAEVLDVTFKEYKGDELKFISFSAKKARGYMSRYICQNGLKKKADMKGFDLEGYAYDENLSTEFNYVFTR